MEKLILILIAAALTAAFFVLRGVRRGWALFETETAGEKFQAFQRAADTPERQAQVADAEMQILRTALLAALRAEFAWIPAAIDWVKAKFTEWKAKRAADPNSTPFGFEDAEKALLVIRHAFVTILFAIAAFSAAIRLVWIPLRDGVVNKGGPDEGAGALTLGLIVVLLVLEALERKLIKAPKDLTA